MEAFIQIPRAWFASDGAWWKLNNEQRAALVTLCSAVAFSEHEVEVKGAKVKLEKGQFVTSRRRLMELLGMSEGNVKGLIKLLKNEGVITILAYKDDLSQHLSQYSILTINDLHDKLSQELSHDIIKDKQKKIFKEKDKEKERSASCASRVFTPPTAEEVQGYLNERGITSFSGQEFVDYYTQGGWVYGSSHTRIKDWKACVRTWQRNRNKYTDNRQPHFTNGNTKENIYTNGIAGRSERLRRAEELIRHTLANPGPSPDEMFDF